jgi:carboxyl-terminal processing protease
MVDEGSASAAEIVAAALQEHGRATVLGQPSYGKGSVQAFIDLRDGSGLKLTTARYYTPRGRTLEGAGITPDIQVDAFASEVVVAGSADVGPDSEQDPEEDLAATSISLEKRLAGDHQFTVARQTVRRWLGGKSGQ